MLTISTAENHPTADYPDEEDSDEDANDDDEDDDDAYDEAYHLEQYRLDMAVELSGLAEYYGDTHFDYQYDS
jgi:hypothetical protein